MNKPDLLLLLQQIETYAKEAQMYGREDDSETVFGCLKCIQQLSGKALEEMDRKLNC